MPRGLMLSLYAMLVLIWSSTWVAIKLGLEDTPALFGAGLRFVLAGTLLLAVARALRRSLRTDAVLTAILALAPFAAAYGLIYWGEQYIPSGLAAVLFGVMPLYTAALSAIWLRSEPVHGRLLAGIGVAIGGLVLAFGESLALGHEERAVLGAAAVVLSPLASAIGTIAIKRRGSGVDPVVLNGWAMLGGGVALLIASAPAEDWSAAVWSAQAVGAVLYLAILGSSVPFVVLTLLLRELTAVQMAYIPLFLPFGALVFGWAIYDEPITALALAGAGLVAAGLLVAQWPPRRRPATAGAAGEAAVARTRPD